MEIDDAVINHNTQHEALCDSLLLYLNSAVRNECESHAMRQRQENLL